MHALILACYWHSAPALSASHACANQRTNATRRTNHGNRNLDLSSRNLDGVELVTSNEVHPYHLLRYDRAIFSQPAIEKLQLSLKKTTSKRQHGAEESEGKGKEPKKAARSPRTRTKKAAEVA